MKVEIEAALRPLTGLPLRSIRRAADLLWLHFGTPHTATAPDGSEREVGEYALQVACPWRLATADRVLVGSGDLLTPADPEAELESFDWDEPGASWLDVRLEELRERYADSPLPVESVEADELGGARIRLGDEVGLELFPTSTPTGHVATEFWRLLQPAKDVPHFVVGTFGIEEEPA